MVENKKIRVQRVLARLAQSVEGWDLDGLIHDLANPDAPRGAIREENILKLLFEIHRQEIEAEIQRRLS